MRTNSKTFFVACGVMAACSGAAMAQIAIDDHLRRTLETPLSSSEILVGRAQFVELEEGDTKELVFAIDPAEKYTIYGACDDECSDINLVARDLNGAIVDNDEEDDDEGEIVRGAEKVARLGVERDDDLMYYVKDGDNWENDSPHCRELLAERILPFVQYFAYIEITPGEPQNLWREYEKLGTAHRNFAMQHIEGLPDIYPVFRELFKKKLV